MSLQVFRGFTARTKKEVGKFRPRIHLELTQRCQVVDSMQVPESAEEVEKS